MKNIAHLLEDPKTGILWMNTYTLDEKCFIKTSKGILDLANFRVIDSEYISCNHFRLCMASYDLITVKNKESMYSVLTPFKDSMGYGALYASICKGFAFKSAYGFGLGLSDYVVAEDANEKWGLICISRSGEIWEDYRSSVFSQPRIIIFFEHDCMSDVLKRGSEMIPGIPQSLTDKNILNLTERNDNIYEIGTDINTILTERKSVEISRLPLKKKELFQELDEWEFIDGETDVMDFIARYLATPTMVNHFAKMFGVTIEFFMRPDILANYILSEYSSKVTRSGACQMGRGKK